MDSLYDDICSPYVVQGPGCEFFNNVRVVTHWNLEANGLDSAWDLEDFIGFNSIHKVSSNERKTNIVASLCL